MSKIKTEFIGEPFEPLIGHPLILLFFGAALIIFVGYIITVIQLDIAKSKTTADEMKDILGDGTTTAGTVLLQIGTGLFGFMLFFGTLYVISRGVKYYR